MHPQIGKAQSLFPSDEPVGNWTANPTRQEASLEMDSELHNRATGGAGKVQSKDRWRVGRRRAGPDWTRRFIRGASRGCKVRVQPGIHHRPSREGQTGATRQGRRGPPDGRDSGQLEDQPHGNAEGNRLQGNLRFSPSAGQGAEDAGKLADSALAKPEGAKPGATREAASRCRKVLGSGATHHKDRRRYRRTV